MSSMPSLGTMSRILRVECITLSSIDERNRRDCEVLAYSDGEYPPTPGGVSDYTKQIADV